MSEIESQDSREQQVLPSLILTHSPRALSIYLTANMPNLMSLSPFSLLTPPSCYFKPTAFPPRPPSLPFLSVKCSSDNNPKPTRSSSWVSPDWLTSLSRSLIIGQDDSGIPVATAKLDDVSELLSGALFFPLFRWMDIYGPIYRLAAGPRNFVVVSDPAIAKHVLRNYGKYAKGLVSEVSEFLFGSGFAIAEGELWTVFLCCFSLFFQ